MKRVLFALVALVGVCSSDCGKISTCSGWSVADPSLSWDAFTQKVHAARQTESEKQYSLLLAEFGSDPAVVRECRMGLGHVFFALARFAEDPQRKHNLHQFAMAMVWDVSRSKYMQCLGSERRVWFEDWLGEFMSVYLGLAGELARHEVAMETSEVGETRIAIATVCDYADPNHTLFGWLGEISKTNRFNYAHRHNYTVVFETESADPGRHPVWSALSLPLRLLESNNFDYVMWMDCDALFVDQTVKIESLLSPGKDLFISEDGRGLSGGNWIVRNSEWSKSLLKGILENPVFDLFDLKDQFGLLWTLLRPGVGAKAANTSEVDLTQSMGYPNQVSLVPQRLLNAYPWALCRPSHHCFEDGRDFIVSFITLGSQGREMARNLVSGFAHRAVGG